MKKEKAQLPRGLHYLGSSIYVSFADQNGKIIRRSLGPVTVQYAKGKREIYKHEVAQGTYQGRQLRPKPEKQSTCADLWRAYLVDRENQGKRTSRLKIAWGFLAPHFAAKPVDEVTTQDLNAYIAMRRAAGRSSGTINREMATLKAAHHHGKRLTPPLVTGNLAFPQRLKENPPRKGFIGDPQYEVLARNAPPVWLRCLIGCAYNFGFRKGELLNLRCRQVDLLDRWIDLEGEDTKNGQPRKIPMTTEVFELMRASVRGKNPDDYVFTREDGRRVVDPRKEWYDLCVRSGLGQFVPAQRKNGKQFLAYRGLNLHDFRRSAIRNMTRRGVSETVAMKISGHKTISVFKRYNIVDERDLEQASRLIEAGRQAWKPEVKTDTKTDTSSYAHS